VQLQLYRGQLQLGVDNVGMVHQLTASSIFVALSCERLIIESWQSKDESTSYR
jgi:hypothetical protein